MPRWHHATQDAAAYGTAKGTWIKILRPRRRDRLTQKAANDSAWAKVVSAGLAYKPTMVCVFFNY